MIFLFTARHMVLLIKVRAGCHHLGMKKKQYMMWFVRKRYKHWKTSVWTHCSKLYGRFLEGVVLCYTCTKSHSESWKEVDCKLQMIHEGDERLQHLSRIPYPLLLMPYATNLHYCYSKLTWLSSITYCVLFQQQLTGQYIAIYKTKHCMTEGSVC